MPLGAAKVCSFCTMLFPVRSANLAGSWIHSGLSGAGWGRNDVWHLETDCHLPICKLFVLNIWSRVWCRPQCPQRFCVSMCQTRKLRYKLSSTSLLSRVMTLIQCGICHWQRTPHSLLFQASSNGVSSFVTREHRFAATAVLLVLLGHVGCC